MKYDVKTFSDKFRSLIGDAQMQVPSQFVIDSLNWAFNTLPTVPKLAKAFSKHQTKQLDANEHFRWDLTDKGFRCIADFALMKFYTTTGGDPCLLPLCYQEPEVFYAMNGLVEKKAKGTPCKYTLEREGDATYLVLDRPSDVPIVVDYIAYGYPKNVESMDDEIEISAIIETLILMSMRDVFYQESEDLSFAGAMLDTMSNKYIVEAEQALNRRWGMGPNAIMGEVLS